MRVSRAGTMVLWALLYVTSVYLGRSLVAEDTGLALFWPAAGVAAAWSWWAFRRGLAVPVVGALVVTTTVVNALSGVGWLASGVFGVANAVQGAVAARLACRPAGESGASGRVVVVVAAVGVASLASAVPGSAGAGLIGAHVDAVLALSWGARNLCGGFVVLSAYLTWAEVLAEGATGRWRDLLTTRRRASGPQEYLAALAVTVVVTGWVFGVPGQLPLAFAVMATSVWVGSRFSPVVAATHSSAVAVAVVVATLADLGPFGTIGSPVERAVVVQLFVLVNAVLTQLLAAGLSDRHDLLVRARQSETRANEQSRLLAAVTDVMHDGLVVVAEDGQFALRNAAAVRMSSSPEQDPDAQLRPASAYGLTEMDGSAIRPEAMPSALAFAGESVVNRELRREEPISGRRTVLSINAAPLMMSDSEATRRFAVMSMRDVTDHHVQVRELEGFAGVVAHDLRNPIAAVMSWAEVVDEALDDLEVDASFAHQGVLRIFGTAERAMGQISELLAFSQAGNKPLHEAVFDLGVVVRDVVDELAPSCPDLLVDWQDLGRVRGDESLVRHLVANVVSNAAKYVAPGVSPRLRVSTTHQDGFHVVDVEDNGVGIPLEHRSRVFDSFYRAPTPGTYPGTGLGLAICARVVERHGGSISALDGSSLGGTRIRFTLPAA